MEVIAYSYQIWYNVYDHEKKIKLNLALHFV